MAGGQLLLHKGNGLRLGSGTIRRSRVEASLKRVVMLPVSASFLLGLTGEHDNMKPLRLKNFNTEFGKGQKPYLPLPARVDGERATFCWQLTWLERLTLLLTGRLWQQVLFFGQPLQPQRLSTKRPENINVR